jgi:hypothetical protein
MPKPFILDNTLNDTFLSAQAQQDFMIRVYTAWSSESAGFSLTPTQAKSTGEQILAVIMNDKGTEFEFNDEPNDAFFQVTLDNKSRGLVSVADANSAVQIPMDADQMRAFARALIEFANFLS